MIMRGKLPPIVHRQQENIMINESRANKPPIEKVLLALRTRAVRKNRIIPFPEVRRVMSWFHFGKHEQDTLLFKLCKEGILKIVAFHGIIIEDEGQVE